MVTAKAIFNSHNILCTVNFSKSTPPPLHTDRQAGRQAGRQADRHEDKQERQHNPFGLTFQDDSFSIFIWTSKSLISWLYVEFFLKCIYSRKCSVLWCSDYCKMHMSVQYALCPSWWNSPPGSYHHTPGRIKLGRGGLWPKFFNSSWKFKQ